MDSEVIYLSLIEIDYMVLVVGQVSMLGSLIDVISFFSFFFFFDVFNLPGCFISQVKGA